MLQKWYWQKWYRQAINRNWVGTEAPNTESVKKTQNRLESIKIPKNQSKSEKFRIGKNRKNSEISIFFRKHIIVINIYVFCYNF